MQEVDKVLLETLDNLDWASYVDICDSVLKVSSKDMDGELAAQAHVYGLWSGVQKIAEKRLAILEHEIEQRMNEAKFEALDDMMTRGIKVTDKKIESFALKDTKYNELKKSLFTTTEKLGWIKSICKALEQRKDMLVQLSANQRGETRLYT